MPAANTHRRASIECIYPPDAFASDAAQNGQVTNQITCGVRILSAPNAAGEFSFERGSRHVPEAPSSTFLVKFFRRHPPLTGNWGTRAYVSGLDARISSIL